MSEEKKILSDKIRQYDTNAQPRAAGSCRHHRFLEWPFPKRKTATPPYALDGKDAALLSVPVRVEAHPLAAAEFLLEYCLDPGLKHASE